MPRRAQPAKQLTGSSMPAAVGRRSRARPRRRRRCVRRRASPARPPARRRRSTRASPSASPVTSTRSSQRGSDGRTITSRLLERVRAQAEPPLEQERDRAGRPRLRLARDRVRHRLVELRAREAGEQLRQAVVVEARGRLEQPLEDEREVLVEAVAAKPERDQRAVVRPHRARCGSRRGCRPDGSTRACARPSR